MKWISKKLIPTLLEIEQLTNIAETLNIQFNNERYCCLAVRYWKESNTSTDINTALRLYDAVFNAAKMFHFGPFCYIGSRLYIVLLVPYEKVSSYTVIKKFYDSICAACDCAVQIGIGQGYSEIDKLSYSCIEAFEALDGIAEGAEISYIEDIHTMLSISARKATNKKQKILELFQQGKLDVLNENVEDLIELVRKESPVRAGQIYPTSIRRTVVELLMEIMHIASDAGVDVDAVVHYQDPYKSVFEFSSTPDILLWFSDVVHNLYDAMETKIVVSERNLLRLAPKYITEHIQDPELSLMSVGKEMRITPTYFSAFLKEKPEWGFMSM